MDTTDASLLQRVRNPRDSTSWREFHALYRPVLKRYALARGLADADAEDVAQECLQTLVKRLPSFEYCREKGRFSNWLRTVVVNQVKKLSSKRRPGQAGTQVWNALQDPDDDQATWERIFLNEHLKFCLVSVRDEFEKKTYQAFEQTVLRDRPIAGVCEALQLNRNQVYLSRSRVLRRLKERMTELVGYEV